MVNFHLPDGTASPFFFGGGYCQSTFLLIEYRWMKIDPVWFTVISDLFVNLSAGWFGVVLIAPNFLTKKSPLKYFLLTSDIVAGIVSLVIAFELKKIP